MTSRPPDETDELAGFVLAVLDASTSLSSHFSHHNCIGKRCYLVGKGSQPLVVQLEDIPMELSLLCANTSESKCARLSGKKSSDSGKGDFLVSLRNWILREKLTTVGTVVDMPTNGEKARAVVLFDIYFPKAFWEGRCYLKSDALSAFVLKHFRCDWEVRSRMLQRIQCNRSANEAQNSKAFASFSPPDLADCHVVDCNVHKAVTDDEKAHEFNLPCLFRSLHPPTEGDWFANLDMRSNIIHAVSSEQQEKAAGMWSLDDMLLSVIFNKLSSPRDLQALSCVCKRTNFLVSSVIPGLNLKLFPHQQYGVRWMLQREKTPKLVPHPFNIPMTTIEGFPYTINHSSGEVYFVEEALDRKRRTGTAKAIGDSVLDFRGGFLCDEPGLGKTITAISVILKDQGKLAEVPKDSRSVSWVEHVNPFHKRMGFYETKDNHESSPPEIACFASPASGDRGAVVHATADKASPQTRATFSSETAQTCLGSASAATPLANTSPESVLESGRVFSPKKFRNANRLHSPWNQTFDVIKTAEQSEIENTNVTSSACLNSEGTKVASKRVNHVNTFKNCTSSCASSTSRYNKVGLDVPFYSNNLKSPRVAKRNSQSSWTVLANTDQAVKRRKILFSLSSTYFDPRDGGTCEMAKDQPEKQKHEQPEQNVASSFQKGKTLIPMKALASCSRNTYGSDVNESRHSYGLKGPLFPPHDSFPVWGSKRPRCSNFHSFLSSIDSPALSKYGNLKSGIFGLGDDDSYGNKRENSEVVTADKNESAAVDDQESCIDPVMQNECSQIVMPEKYRTRGAGEGEEGSAVTLPKRRRSKLVRKSAEALQKPRIPGANSSFPEKDDDKGGDNAIRDGQRIRDRPTFARQPSEASKMIETNETQALQVPGKAKKGTNACEEYVYEHEGYWIECSACHKWRRMQVLPPGYNAADDWYCSMNPDLLYRSCSIPEEHHGEDIYVQTLPGFFNTSNGRDYMPGNVLFFEGKLQVHMDILTKQGDVLEAVRWLSRLGATDLQKLACERGLAIPSRYSDTSRRLAPIFLSFGLQRKSNESRKRKESGEAWHNPPKLNPDLVFDAKALRYALVKILMVSPSLEPVGRVFLSGATLIVVPSHLIGHWVSQIKKHVEPNRLRMLVLEGSDARPMPAHRLAWDYDVVITTFSKLSSQWTALTKERGSPVTDAKPRYCSVLMKVHWLRIILDEGHTLGSSLSLTNKLQMAVALRSCYRWVLTGTPTPNTPSSQVNHIQPLLRFLHEEVFGDHHRLFEQVIQRPFESYDREGFERLKALLKRSMLATDKQKISFIPKCSRTEKVLKFTESHAQSYNSLVEMLMKNLLMADWKDENHEESLLNMKHSEKARLVLNNVRLSCCVSGNISLGEWQQDISTTMKLLEEQDANNPCQNHRHALVELALRSGGTCERCFHQVKLPWVTPHCHHVVCTKCCCLEESRKQCPVCAREYIMQEPNPRKENRNPQWAVPFELIELQPSYAQQEWNAAWAATPSSKVEYLLQKMKEIWQRNNDEFNKKISLWRSFSQKQKHFSSDFFQNTHYFMLSHTVGNDSAIDNLNPSNIDDEMCGETFRLDKIIVFSQFPEHLQLIESQEESLQAFQYDANVNVLLMDSSGALGLDLSFANHVFLMEPVLDKSIEEQIVARAWRMGATKPIYVEILAMEGTVEENILDMARGIVGENVFSANNRLQAKDLREQKYRILKNLSFV